MGHSSRVGRQSGLAEESDIICAQRGLAFQRMQEAEGERRPIVVSDCSFPGADLHFSGSLLLLERSYSAAEAQRTQAEAFGCPLPT